MKRFLAKHTNPLVSYTGFSRTHTALTEVRKSLYISLVWAKSFYYSPLWKPYLLKDIELLEGVQQRATKFILSDFSSDYRTRLTKIGILATNARLWNCWHFIFYDSLKQSSNNFNILDHVAFTTGTTRSAGIKLYPKTASTNYIMNTYSYCLPHLWNSIIDLSQPVNVIKSKLKTCLWNHFLGEFWQ